ncbi:hypothetical protein SAMN04487764_0424 [Gillisia sp. Hel1_33_143]|nr:hypothetical protein [Gillisia sp. Hel_I_29]SDR72417.1 hypothetical protein SAMN04487764_0424 [Gillisia sp. Hel1_33_143]
MKLAKLNLSQIVIKLKKKRPIILYLLKITRREKMIFKLGLKIGIIAIEIALAFYSFILTDSLMVKFLFFTFSAIIVAFAVTKITNVLLPADKDYVSEEIDYEDISIK